tara:strand:+ start:2812 stop:3597 length:786 start_codon:yes stop_codon:yes gene_type:complete
MIQKEKDVFWEGEAIDDYKFNLENYSIEGLFEQHDAVACYKCRTHYDSEEEAPEVAYLSYEHHRNFMIGHKSRLIFRCGECGYQEKQWWQKRSGGIVTEYHHWDNTRKVSQYSNPEFFGDNEQWLLDNLERCLQAVKEQGEDCMISSFGLDEYWYGYHFGQHKVFQLLKFYQEMAGKSELEFVKFWLNPDHDGLGHAEYPDIFYCIRVRDGSEYGDEEPYKTVFFTANQEWYSHNQGDAGHMEYKTDYIGVLAEVFRGGVA